MTFEVLADVDAVARRAADIVVEEARAAMKVRGRFVVAISGGRTPWVMLRALSALDLPWTNVHVIQVDERIAPTGHPDRNLTHLRASLRPDNWRDAAHVHAMPVEWADLDAATERYTRTLVETAGLPPVIDLVHLGLGTDGHTASLIPDDPLLDVTGADVAVTGMYQGRRRMTLTYPVLNRARRVMWMITGEEKADMLVRLGRGDHGIPAGRVRQDRAVVLADVAAAQRLTPA